MKIARLAITLALLAACSEATDGVIAQAWSPPIADEAGDDAVGATQKDGSATPAKLDASVVTASVVLLNELSPGGEWVEIVNAGEAPVDLGGWMVADRDKATGGPKTKDGAIFPAGTTLAPGAYGIVLGGGVDAGDPCPVGGQAFCTRAGFGISKKDGETIFLLAPTGETLGTMVFPPSPDIAKTSSWCRTPDADPAASFQLCEATPGATN